MPVARGRLAPIAQGGASFLVMTAHAPKIEEIEPANETQQLEQSRTDAVRSDNRCNREQLP